MIDVTPPPSDLFMWSGLVGFGLPLVIAVIIQSRWSDTVKAIVAFVACCAAGAGTAYFSGHFQGRSIVSAVLVVMTVGMALYQGFYKPSGITAAIRSATDFGGPRGHA